MKKSQLKQLIKEILSDQQRQIAQRQAEQLNQILRSFNELPMDWSKKAPSVVRGRVKRISDETKKKEAAALVDAIAVAMYGQGYLSDRPDNWWTFGPGQIVENN
jgi:hypothetical protein